MNNSVFYDSEDAAIRLDSVCWNGLWNTWIWGAGDCTMKRPWSLWRKSLEKWGLSNQNKNPAPTTQCLWYGTVTRCHTSSIFQMHQHYAAVSVSWLTSVVTPTAPRRDFNNALYWCKISIKSSSLHDLQSFTTKRTNWVVLVFFAFFPLWITLLLLFPTLLLDRVVMLPKHVVRILRWIRFVPAVPVPIGCFLLGRDFHGEKSIKFFSFHVKSKSEVYHDVAFIFPKGSKCVRICRKVGNAVNFADWRWMNYILFRSRGECDRSLVHQLPLTIADGSKQTVGWLKTAGCAVVWKQHDTHRWNCIGNQQSHHPLRKLAEA